MPGETLSQTRSRASEVLERLRTLYPDARTELRYSNPFELLVAVMLSAQATDVSVNAATPALFAKYPDAGRLARAAPEEVERLIDKINFYRGKARNLVRTAQLLEERHGGAVPNDFDALLELPGVGRKTANVVLGSAYGRPAIAVDTHVRRLAQRLGFSEESDPDRVEVDLERLFPREDWVFVHHSLILHGRRICTARKPDCASCVLNTICPSSRV